MKFQKSPFSYLCLLTGIIIVALYSNLTIGKKISKPIVHNLEHVTTNSEIAFTSNSHSIKSLIK